MANISAVSAQEAKGTQKASLTSDINDILDAIRDTGGAVLKVPADKSVSGQYQRYRNALRQAGWTNVLVRVSRLTNEVFFWEGSDSELLARQKRGEAIHAGWALGRAA